MIIRVKHHFAKDMPALYLFEGNTYFADFRKKLLEIGEFLPEDDPIKYGRFIDQIQNRNKILGDGFELFCELFVILMGHHPCIGLGNYIPVPQDKDVGIDAFADNLSGERSAVQCKFTSDPTYEFTAKSNLSNFLNAATLSEIGWNVEDGKIKRAFLITSSSGLKYWTEEQWKHMVHVIDIKTIKLLTDNNKLFWDSCVRLLKENG
jgi:hypothetical protein